MSDPRRVALVTGASQGLGKAIALRLAKDGRHVSLNDIPSKTDALKEVASLVEQHGVRSAVFPGDVTKESDVKAMIDGTADALGGFDVVRADCGSRWKACSASPAPAPSPDGRECRHLDTRAIPRRSAQFQGFLQAAFIYSQNRSRTSTASRT